MIIQVFVSRTKNKAPELSLLYFFMGALKDVSMGHCYTQSPQLSQYVLSFEVYPAIRQAYEPGIRKQVFDLITIKTRKTHFLESLFF